MRSQPQFAPLSRWSLAALVTGLLACGGGRSPDEQHGEAERRTSAGLLGLATGRTDTEATPTRHPWPVTLSSIGHTTASYQNYGGSPYFHHGLDIRAEAGSDVIASVGGKVVNIENYVAGDPAYWEIAILDAEGFLWQYHHVERSSIPQAIFEAKTSGRPIADGTKIGEVYYWSVTTYGERYHHIHLNILGAGDAYLNPFDFLTTLQDTQAPVFVDVGLLKNGARVSGRSVTGAYTVYAQVHDLIMHQQFVVPAQSLVYSVDGGEPVTVWDFASLPGGASEEDFVHSYFVRSLTCGNYTCRKLTVDLGFDRAGQRLFTNTLGSHTVAITARDYVGNETSTQFSWTVQ